MEVLQATGPILCWHHLRIGRNGEVFRDERVLVHFAAKDERELDGTTYEFVAFQFRLAASDIERSDQLKVRRSASMSEEGFLKSGLGAFPAIVIHHDVGTLAEAGERLVRRRRSIDTQLYCVGIWQEVGVE